MGIARHGTRARYQRGCRCKKCVEANRAAARRYYREHYSVEARRGAEREEYLCDECGRLLRGRWREAEHEVLAFGLGRRHVTRFVFCSGGHADRFRSRIRAIPVVVDPPGEPVPRAGAPPTKQARALAGARR